MEVLDGVLANRLLNNGNLPGKKIQLIRATANKIKYEIMKEQLKKVFTRLSFKKLSREEAAKLEQCDSFCTENFVKRECNENALYGKSAVKILHEIATTVNQKRNRKPLQNPLDSDMKVISCRTCDSKFHLANRCPKRNDIRETIFIEEMTVSLLADSFNVAIIDSGCTKTVCGEVWIQYYTDSLSISDKDKINICKSSNSF